MAWPVRADQPGLPRRPASKRPWLGADNGLYVGYAPTGLYHYRARYYSPGFNRFSAEDPACFLDGDSNLYAYVTNSPVMFSDPSGLEFALRGSTLIPTLTLVPTFTYIRQAGTPSFPGTGRPGTGLPPGARGAAMKEARKLSEEQQQKVDEARLQVPCGKAVTLWMCQNSVNGRGTVTVHIGEDRPLVADPYLTYCYSIKTTGTASCPP
jgi:RHS repeat-associated protein